MIIEEGKEITPFFIKKGINRIEIKWTNLKEKLWNEIRETFSRHKHIKKTIKYISNKLLVMVELDLLSSLYIRLIHNTSSITKNYLHNRRWLIFAAI